MVQKQVVLNNFFKKLFCKFVGQECDSSQWRGHQVCLLCQNPTYVHCFTRANVNTYHPIPVHHKLHKLVELSWSKYCITWHSWVLLEVRRFLLQLVSDCTHRMIGGSQASPVSSGRCMVCQISGLKSPLSRHQPTLRYQACLQSRQSPQIPVGSCWKSQACGNRTINSLQGVVCVVAALQGSCLFLREVSRLFDLCTSLQSILCGRHRVISERKQGATLDSIQLFTPSGSLQVSA